MRLSKLKLAGFKSFVDATTLLTPGQLVGIVGPNGCGKSNVIDAVRWVLGETRASALRGESMQDVIFSGSNTRKPVSRASVEMIFDNAEGRAAGQWSQYAEISVKRVVDRSGESDYLINNVRVRRKDVIDLFLGTGLGPRAYAIIEQGMISRVIEARPEEVRAFLEEAAGITKYKERRRETEGRLSDARDNLVRLEDILAELTQQIERLQSQAVVATQYRDIQTSLIERQHLLWRYRREQAKSLAEQADEQIKQTQAQLEREAERARVLVAKVAAARETHARLAEGTGVCQGEVYAASAEVSRVESELKALRDKHQRLLARVEQLSASQQQWQERASALAQETATWEARRESDAGALGDSQAKLQLAQTELARHEEVVRQAQRAFEQASRATHIAEQQAQTQNAHEQASRRALQSLAQRQERLSQERAALPVPDADLLLDAEGRCQQLGAEGASLSQQQAQCAQSLEAAQSAQRAAQVAEREATRVLTERRARLNAAQALQARLRDQGDLPRWLREAGLADLAPVWQSLHVDAGWELAVESLLRERIAALAPQDVAAWQTALKAPVPQSLSLLRQSPAAGAVLPAAELTSLRSRVRCPQSLAPFLDDWLAGVYCVDSHEAYSPYLTGAQTLAAGLRLVAPSGAVLSASVLSLYSPDARTHGALERQREIEMLSAQLDALAAEQSSAMAALSAAEQAVQLAQSQQAQLRQALAAQQNNLHAAKLELVKQQQAAARHGERLAQIDRELRDIAASEQAEQGQLASAKSSAQQFGSQAQALRGQQDVARQAVQHSEAAQKTARDQLAQAAHAQQAAVFAARESAGKLEDLARNRRLAEEQLARSSEERGQLQLESSQLGEQDLQRSLQTALDMLAGREQALLACRNQLEAAASQMRTLDEERLRCEHALEPLREQLNAARMNQQAASLSIQQADERLAELQAPPHLASAQDLAEVRETALAREVARLTRELADLGPVNLAALDEVTTAGERKSFLDAQYADLNEAIDTLEAAIRRIDRETRTQLQETYNTVNRHFGELFPQLFGGGEAALILSGDEILDAGVQIVARPPGKKNTSIHLLSGGEKALTAIALVFAMFQLNPAPFCMLDEVDAPLDDTNTERYCEMVKRMSAVTQFIYISHSKITMEMAHQLIGVTMQEKGVSRVVEVDIDTAMKLALPVAPATAAV